MNSNDLFTVFTAFKAEMDIRTNAEMGTAHDLQLAAASLDAAKASLATAQTGSDTAVAADATAAGSTVSLIQALLDSIKAGDATLFWTESGLTA